MNFIIMTGLSSSCWSSRRSLSSFRTEDVAILWWNHGVTIGKSRGNYHFPWLTDMIYGTSKKIQFVNDILLQTKTIYWDFDEASVQNVVIQFLVSKLFLLTENWDFLKYLKKKKCLSEMYYYENRIVFVFSLRIPLFIGLWNLRYCQCLGM